MIYNKYVIPYPSNTIIKDAARRSNLNVDSYSPISDTLQVIIENKRARQPDMYAALNLDDILLTIRGSDIKYERLKDTVNRYNSTIEGEQEYISEEEIRQLTDPVLELIYDYFKQCLDRWSYVDTKAGYRSLNVSRVAPSITLRDNSDGEYETSLDELLIDDESEDKREEEILMSNVQKLTYYLKLLQECSITYGISILQMLILGERYKWNASLVVKDGIYQIGSKGEFVLKYSASLNSNPKFKDWWNLVEPNGRDHPIWGNIIKEFMSTIRELGIDLSKEDINNYSTLWVNDQICTYLASNEEYSETFGRVDQTVLSMLSPDKLLEVKNNVVGFDSGFMLDIKDDSLIQTFADYRDKVAAELEAIDGMFALSRYKAASVNKSESILLRNREDYTKDFLIKTLAHVYGITYEESIKKYYNRYVYDENGILCALSGDGILTTLKLRGTTLCNVWGVTNAPQQLNVTDAGLFIWPVLNDKNKFKFCPIEEAVFENKGKFPDGEIKGF